MADKVEPRKRKLTVDFCRTAQPQPDSDGSARSQTIWWDTEVTGLGLRVTATGVRSFILDYRPRTGRGMPQRRMTLSKVGDPMTLHQAREEARRIRHEARAAGADPLEARRRIQRAKTLAELVPAFLEHIEAKRKPRTAADYRRLLERVICQRFGSTRLIDIRRADVAKWHQGLKNTPAEANHALRVLSSLFSWAIRHEHTAAVANPCAYVDHFQEAPRERYLTSREYARLARALGAASRSGLVNSAHTLAIALIVLTGARMSEILALQWAWYDPARLIFRLPDSKSGRKNLTLSQAAAALVEAVPRVAGNLYVLPGSQPGRPIVNLQKSWDRIRKAALLPDVRLHDLRHAYASAAISEGLTLEVLGRLLGHKSIQATRRYAHLLPSAEKAAAEKVTEAIVGPFMPHGPGKVLQFPSGAPMQKRRRPA